jgi:AmmeMemoRadiSam system protein B/AmmeMemoRadiSam system protein A
MTNIRPAAVAGMFYPGTARELDAMIREMLRDAPPPPRDAPAPKAIIAPHAGYMYSGPIAAAAYVRIKPLAGQVRRVVLVGPSHRVPLQGLAVPGADAFATPLGVVAVDRQQVETLLALPQVTQFDATHEQEHCLEVHLPFLQTVLDDFSIVPLVAGEATAAEVAEVLERVWGGEETLIVVSSDLSHYLDYMRARAIDALTCQAIEALDPASIAPEQACGRVPLAGLLTLAKRHGLQVTTLDLRNSGDTAGDRRHVVGYGAWVFSETQAERAGHGRSDAGAETGRVAATERILKEHGATLVQLAATAIEYGLRFGNVMPVNGSDYPEPLRQAGASFVTLTQAGRLRGCVGTPQAFRPLVEDVADNSFAAAFCDGRFLPLTRADFDTLDVSISLLSPPEAMAFASEDDLLRQLRPHDDGLIIDHDGRRALFLPQVWTTLPERRLFLGQLKLKAGMAADAWSDSFRAWRFRARSVSSRTLADG